MRLTKRLLSLFSLLLAHAALAQVPAPQPVPAPLTPEQAALKSHIQFLASDAMRGREAGTRDFDIAAEYMASEMLAAGLRPGGDKGGWFQPVTLASYKPAEAGTMALLRGTTVTPLRFGEDFLNDPTPATPEFKLTAPVVFAGYGIVYPEGKRDDYRGLDVRGKIVAILPGVPKGLPNEVEAHLGDSDQKARLAEARGARGVIVLESAARRDGNGFDSYAPYYDYARWTWADANGAAHAVAPGAPVIGYLSQAGAAKLFIGAAIKWADVLAAEKKGARLPTGALAATLDVSSRTRVRTSASRNVVGVLEGSDPRLRNEYVILSAHLDHVGVGQPVAGDNIYNGAMDNAVGNAIILEIARRFQASGKRPRRSILFVSLTGEEIGLIGSDYFAHFPTVPKGSIVADINIDMPILTYKLADLVVDGEERMSLGPVIRKAAAAEGLAVVPDPTPEEMFFVRSDHYSFVQAGIPAVSIDTGPGGEGAVASKKFLDENYHEPSDQIDLPWNWDSAVTYLNVAWRVANTVADDDARPRFNKGDFFGVLFDGPGAK